MCIGASLNGTGHSSGRWATDSPRSLSSTLSTPTNPRAEVGQGPFAEHISESNTFYGYS